MTIEDPINSAINRESAITDAVIEEYDDAIVELQELTHETAEELFLQQFLND